MHRGGRQAPTISPLNTHPVMSTKRFLGINFWNRSLVELLQEADLNGGLFTVPSAPSLAMMRSDPLLTKSYQSSDYSVVDGGYVAIVLKLIFGKFYPRISGLQILQRLLCGSENHVIPFHKRHILWVVPHREEKQRIEKLLDEKNFPRELQYWHRAPHYKKDEDFQDKKLMELIGVLNPDWIVLCIGGGRQEKLGYYLRSKNTDLTASGRGNGPVILCTGGAISFLTGGQANIPTWADRLYLGWLCRVLHEPKVFLPRYWNAGWEFPLLLWKWRTHLFT
ncbi:MAG: WecB/TagA/CpsF family glycosyltransferase [Luteolibacter sp.]